MNRIEICKNIIQSIKDYITNPTMIEAHRVKNHFVRNRKLTMQQVIQYLFYSSKSRVRVIVVKLPDGSNEFLATNLFDETIAKDMFRELYFYRWPVETKYQELKSRFQLEEFNGATKTAVYQEFYINLLLSNLSSLIKNNADDMITTCAKASNRHRYQANRSFIIGRIKTVLPRILIRDPAWRYRYWCDTGY